jgi:ABC-type branched-subunit amino acid transport system permease subunit
VKDQVASPDWGSRLPRLRRTLFVAAVIYFVGMVVFIGQSQVTDSPVLSLLITVGAPGLVMVVCGPAICRYDAWQRMKHPFVKDREC